jgi:hypothetical protein
MLFDTELDLSAMSEEEGFDAIRQFEDSLYTRAQQITEDEYDTALSKIMRLRAQYFSIWG